MGKVKTYFLSTVQYSYMYKQLIFSDILYFEWSLDPDPSKTKSRIRIHIKVYGSLIPEHVFIDCRDRVKNILQNIINIKCVLFPCKNWGKLLGIMYNRVEWFSTFSCISRMGIHRCRSGIFLKKINSEKSSSSDARASDVFQAKSTQVFEQCSDVTFSGKQ